MKKLLGIVVLSLLFISIDLSNPTRVEAGYTYEEMMERANMNKLERILYDLNPARYLKKRKECKEEADRADTVYQGKERYKDCMDD